MAVPSWRHPAGVILGVDPGVSDCGWGAIRIPSAGSAPLAIPGAWGVIRTGPGDSMPDRVDDIVRQLRRVIALSAPVALAVEAWLPYQGKRGAGAGANTLRVCGAIRALALCLGLPCYEYSAQAVKGIVLGGQRFASKSGVQDGVKATLGLSKVPRPTHAADALAVALALARTGPHPGEVISASAPWAG